MKLNVATAIIASLFITSISFAQSTKQDLSVSDEELLKYANTMDSISEMQASVRLEIGDMIKNSSVMDIARYNSLNKIINDPTQLEAAKATPAEIAFVKQVSVKQEEEVNKIKTAYQNMAKDYVTPKVFNKVKKAVAEDQQTKQRYDSLMFVLGKDNLTSGQ